MRGENNMVKIVHYELKPDDFDKVLESVKNFRNRPEGRNLPEKEVIKETLKSLTTEVQLKQETAPQAPPPAPVHGTGTSIPLPSYLGDNTPKEIEEAVQKLVKIAIDDGLQKAVAAAKQSPPFIEDVFHDTLAEHLLPELKKRRVI